MAPFGLFYVLVSIALLVVAIAVHINSSTLSIPISPFVSICTILLPILAFLNTSFHPTALSIAQAPSSRLKQLTPFILQTLQALIATILATLLFQDVIPGQVLECGLDGTWMVLFRSKDSAAVRRIQDRFDCCGLNSVKDRAYPFPKSGVSTCAETYGRSTACRDPWRAAVQNHAGADLMVVLAIGLLQIFALIILRKGASGLRNWRLPSWLHVTGQRESRRPLLTGLDRDEEDAVERVTEQQSYGATDGEGSGGPRVEPSSMHERNTWNDH